MNNTLNIDLVINDIERFQASNLSLLQLQPIEKYKLVKDVILQSDSIVFYIMTGCFLENDIDDECMDVLKRNSEKYCGLTVNYPVQGYSEAEEPAYGDCYFLDVSTDEKKKLFFDNYCFYEHENFLIVMPEMDTSDERSFAPYKFYFLSGAEIKMIAEHHTGTVTFVW
jgi:hypothetical protein